MIFLDVGAHEGQTLEGAVRYDFERIYAFEPMPAQFARLEERFGDVPNVELRNFGLAASTGTLPPYGTNESLEASLYPDKEDVDESVVTECEFVAASEWFAANVTDGAVVKLNCEGAELQILHDLIHSGEIQKVSSLLVDFDSHHIPGLEHGEAEIRRRLLAAGFDRLVTSEEVVPNGKWLRVVGMYRYTRADEIMCWLKSQGIAER